MTDQHKAFYLSLALCIFETVKEHEKPNGTRYRKLANCSDKVDELVDLYRPEKWPYEELQKAEVAHDRIVEMIESMFA